jgi:hypothetical protein
LISGQPLYLLYSKARPEPAAALAFGLGEAGDRQGQVAGDGQAAHGQRRRGILRKDTRQSQRQGSGQCAFQELASAQQVHGNRIGVPHG